MISDYINAKIVILGFTIFLFLLSVACVSASGDTIVSLDPSSLSVSGDESFNVSIYCTPSQPIKAFELTLSFDASLLQANSVAEGDIFSGYDTFFNGGIIDNTEGSIVNVYDLIIGSGNVSSPGSLIKVSFTSKDESGSCSLDVDDVGITDELGYISVDVSDGSVSVQSTSSNPPSGGGVNTGGGGVYLPPAPIVVDNNVPEQPLKPSGPIFIEVGVEYEYSSSTFDVDGDLIRYKFDWGDGEFSDWSELFESNGSVLMIHSWDDVSVYEIKVIAQDEEGNNSSWSIPLNVTVSQTESEWESPVAEISVPVDVSADDAIVFDASSSFDLDGAIVSYYWNFGDGTNGSGITPSHVYDNPGEYIVTLTVTDNNGKTSSQTMIVEVGAGVEGQSEENQGVLSINWNSVIIVIVAVASVCLIMVLTARRKSLFSHRYYYRSSQPKIFDTQRKIDRINAMIDELELKRFN